MARTTRAKKQTQVSKEDIGAEIFASLRDLEALKGIPVDYMVERLKQALTNAYRKDRDERRDNATDNIVVDISEKGLSMHQVKTVVEEVTNPTLEITLDAARNLDPGAVVGGTVQLPIDIQKFGRIAAQTAKQVVIQGIREAERGMAMDTGVNKAQELVTATVVKLDPEGDAFVQIGQGTEAFTAVLQITEQIPGETFAPGDLVRVYVLDKRGNRGGMPKVSRTHPNFVRRLFELEVPEIAEGQVEIRNLTREAGARSKMSVFSSVEGVDPVGACVGPRGGRVAAVVEELHGEKVDIVTWSEDPCKYVKSAISPANALSVELVPGEKACLVIVPDDQLSLAIGKEGQNARLAARLTGYKIDIRSASQAAAATAAE